MRRVYLDNAATSWPKCQPAVEAAMKFINQCGATTGRGTYRSAREADQWLSRARVALAQLIGAPSPDSIAFCTSGTHALNAGLMGVLQPGQRVITTAAEHNSVLRPLRRLAERLQLDLLVVPCDATGRADLEAAEKLASNRCDWLVIGHASNVTGVVQDLASWAQLARRLGARLFVDAAQTVGYVPIDISAVGIDVLASAGHKGLRGLAGTGFLYVAPDLQQRFQPSMWGGTGLASFSDQVEDSWPTSVEVGNLNLPGIISLAVAAEVLLDQGKCQDWQSVFRHLVAGLHQLADMQLVGVPSPDFSREERVPVASITVPGWSVHDLAGVLDSHFGVEVRAGYHCAARIHRFLGTEATGGTLRLSTCEATTKEEIDYALNALREIACVQTG